MLYKSPVLSLKVHSSSSEACSLLEHCHFHNVQPAASFLGSLPGHVQPEVQRALVCFHSSCPCVTRHSSRFFKPLRGQKSLLTRPCLGPGCPCSMQCPNTQVLICLNDLRHWEVYYISPFGQDVLHLGNFILLFRLYCTWQKLLCSLPLNCIIIFSCISTMHLWSFSSVRNWLIVFCLKLFAGLDREHISVDLNWYTSTWAVV